MSNILTTGSIVQLNPFSLTIDVNYTGVLTTFTYPAGTAYDHAEDINIGSINVAGTLWTIPSYIKDFNASITIFVEITDIDVFSALPDSGRIVTGDTTDLTGEVLLLDNVAEKTILGITCPDIINCSGFPDYCTLPEYGNMQDAIIGVGYGKPFLTSIFGTAGWFERHVAITTCFAPAFTVECPGNFTVPNCTYTSPSIIPDVTGPCGLLTWSPETFDAIDWDLINGLCTWNGSSDPVLCSDCVNLPASCCATGGTEYVVFFNMIATPIGLYSPNEPIYNVQFIFSDNCGSTGQCEYIWISPAC